MYDNSCFYGLTDLLHFNVYASLLKEHIIKEERVIIKIFKQKDEIVVIETNNFQDTILKDTRKDKSTDLMAFDLVFLHTLERYYSDYEIKGMVYEYIEGVGSWYKVHIPNHNPEDKIYKPFYLKKKITKEDLSKYAKSEEDYDKLLDLYSITKGLIKFTRPKTIKELFSSLEE